MRVGGIRRIVLGLVKGPDKELSDPQLCVKDDESNPQGLKYECSIGREDRSFWHDRERPCW